MYRSLASVGGFTLLSRATGFLRDIVLSATIGGGGLADVFFVAFKLPNHFRAIFGEGAFNAAYVPSYSQVLEKDGAEPAHDFSSQIFTLLLLSQIVLLALAWAFMPNVVDLLAPGFRRNPHDFDLAVSFTRITFPYLLFITINTLQSGTLNANGRFAAAAFAPVLLNLSTIAFLAIAFVFPNAGYAASVGTMVSGVLQVGLTGYASWRVGILEGLVRPRFTADVKRFFVRLGPAVIGSAGAQIAMFADTIIATLLPVGAVSSIYYADRMYQLPLGVIGIAAGTVLLPEMSRKLAVGNEAAAYQAQNRTIALSVALSAPFFVAFIMLPDWIMRAIFEHGAFTGQAADRSAGVLEAYGFGLLAIVLIRSATASFLARGDTTTPMIVALLGFALNVALKLALFRPFGAVGLAMATAAGAWCNLGLLVILALRRDQMRPDATMARVGAAVALASGLLAIVTLVGPELSWIVFRHAPRFGFELTFLATALLGGVVYGAMLLAGLHAFGVDLPRLPRFVLARGPRFLRRSSSAA